VVPDYGARGRVLSNPRKDKSEVFFALALGLSSCPQSPEHIAKRVIVLNSDGKGGFLLSGSMIYYGKTLHIHLGP
jgi:hypothetical protein